MNDTELDVLEDFGKHSSHCGYCKRDGKTGISHGMWAHSLSAAAYQALLDRGWRRSGRYIYKPDLHTCCPQYTIRLDSRLFVPSKSQQRIQRRAERPQPDLATSGAAPAINGNQPQQTSPEAAIQHRAQAERSSMQPKLSSSPQHDRQGGDSQEAMLANAIDAAVAGCVKAGALPQAQYAAGKVLHPSPKQRKQLPEDVRLTSPSAMAVASTARKAQPQQHASFSAISVAEMLAASVNDRKLPTGWTVFPSAGHLNCVMPAEEDAKGQHQQELANESCSNLHGACTAEAAPAASGGYVKPPSAAAKAKGAEPRQEGVQSPQPNGAAPATEPAAADELPRVRIGKRRSFDSMNDIEGMSPPSSRQRSETWQGVEGASPMSISNLSPALGSQHLFRSGSLAAVTSNRQEPPAHGLAALSRSVSEQQLQRGASPGTSPMSGLAAPDVWAPQLGTGAANGSQQAAGASASPAAPGVMAPHASAGMMNGSQQAAGHSAVPAAPDRWVPDSGTGAFDGAQQWQDERGATEGAQQPQEPRSSNSSSSGSGAEAAVAPGAAEQADETAASEPADDNFRRKTADAGAGTRGGSGSDQGCVLEVRMVPATRELVDTEFELYKDYQVSQHGERADEVSPRQFIRFLVDSPLPAVELRTPAGTAASAANGASGAQPANSSSTAADAVAATAACGTFHMQYWLGPRLAAVSVVDVLPKCLSSVYMFWDKQYAHLSLGKYSVLREVDFVRRASHSRPSLRYVYLGYYIPGNEKMMYKADFRPSDVLCPQTLCWVPHERAQAAMLASGSYVGLAALPRALAGLGAAHGLSADGTPDASATQADGDAVWQTLLLLLAGPSPARQLVRLGQLLQMRLLSQADAPKLVQQVEAVQRLVGPEVGRRLVLIVQNL